MINRPSNWDNVQAYSEFQRLPVGAYVCTIKRAAVQASDYGAQLCVLIDINAGEYAGYYQEDYNRNQREDKKWKGVLRLWLPKEDGSDKDEWTKSILKGFVTAVEESNRGYRWNWDENSLAKKEVGVIFRNEEWEWNGKSGWSVRPFRAISVDSVEDGSYTLPKDKPLKNKVDPAPAYPAPDYSSPSPSFGGYEAPESLDFAILEDNDAQLPF